MNLEIYIYVLNKNRNNNVYVTLGERNIHYKI